MCACKPHGFHRQGFSIAFIKMHQMEQGHGIIGISERLYPAPACFDVCMMSTTCLPHARPHAGLMNNSYFRLECSEKYPLSSNILIVLIGRVYDPHNLMHNSNRVLGLLTTIYARLFGALRP